MWSKLKAFLRKEKIRIASKLPSAISKGFLTIRPKGLCEKISVNSKTVIKVDILERLKNNRSNFLQHTTDTVICQGSLDISLPEWSTAEWNQADIRRLSRTCRST